MVLRFFRRDTPPTTLYSMRVFVRMIVVVLMLLIPLPALGQVEIDEDVLYLFWGDGCPHCAAEKEFLADLTEEYPELEIEQYEVWFDMGGRARFVATMQALGEEPRSVPVTIYGGRLWVGYDDSVGNQIEALVESRLRPPDDPTDPVVPDESNVIHIPIIGDVDVSHTSLLPATLVIALVDGFNPCSLWVLSILLALVLRTGSRRRVLAVGGMFLLVTTLLYGLYIAGLYSALSYAAHATWIRVVMAVIALAFGIINIKDFVWFKQGVSLTIPEKAKPGIYARMRSISDADRPLPGVLMGTAGLAIGVSLLETPCTAGYPLLWSNLLAENQVGWAPAALLFGAYMLVFLIDELAVFGTAVVAMRAAKLDERAGRSLKLIGGVLMVVLAFTLIFFPDAMNSLSGAIVVFLVAGAITAVGLMIDAIVRRRRPASPPKRKRPTAAHR